MNEILRALRVVTWATVALFLVVAALATGGFLLLQSQQSGLHDQQAALHRQQEALRDQQAAVAKLSRDTNQALCALRGGLKRQVEAARKYLKETPDAIPGITPAQIRQSIATQEQTIGALSNLDCR